MTSDVALTMWYLLQLFLKSVFVNVKKAPESCEESENFWFNKYPKPLNRVQYTVFEKMFPDILEIC